MNDHMPTRRQVMRIGATTVVFSTFLRGSPAFAAGAAVPLRKNIDSLSADELSTYKHAVEIVIQRGVADPAVKEGYAWQAALHNDFERERCDDSVGACEHRSELFFPWHRAHLAGFEFLLRAADPPRTANVTIPYWDWTQPHLAHASPRPSRIKPQNFFTMDAIPSARKRLAFSGMRNWQ